VFFKYGKIVVVWLNKSMVSLTGIRSSGARNLRGDVPSGVATGGVRLLMPLALQTLFLWPCAPFTDADLQAESFSVPIPNLGFSDVGISGFSQPSSLGCPLDVAASCPFSPSHFFLQALNFSGALRGLLHLGFWWGLSLLWWRLSV